MTTPHHGAEITGGDNDESEDTIHHESLQTLFSLGNPDASGGNLRHQRKRRLSEDMVEDGKNDVEGGVSANAKRPRLGPDPPDSHMSDEYFGANRPWMHQTDGQGSSLGRVGSQIACVVALAERDLGSGSVGADDAAEDGPTGVRPSQRTSQLSSVGHRCVSIHQTPMKYASDSALQSRASSNQPRIIQQPTRRLKFGSSHSSNLPDPSSAVSGQIGEHQRNEMAGVILRTNGSSSLGSAIVQQTPRRQPFDSIQHHHSLSRPERTLVSPWTCCTALCLLIFLAFSPSAIMSTMQDQANENLDFFKRCYHLHFPPPKRSVVNQTRVDEIDQMKLEQQEFQQVKRVMVEDLEAVQLAMEREIELMEKDASELKQRFRLIEERVENHRAPAARLKSRISTMIHVLVEEGQRERKDALSPLQEIWRFIVEADKKKLLDLSSLDLWEIPVAQDCLNGEETDEEDQDEGLLIETDSSQCENRVTPMLHQARLDEWLNVIVANVAARTSENTKNDETANQIRRWIRLEIKQAMIWEETIANFTYAVLEKEVAKKETQPDSHAAIFSKQTEAIVALVLRKLEIEVADNTGKFDFASVFNGAEVITFGPRATSRSLVQNLPFFNRLLSHFGFRFYGYGAEAALTPTDLPVGLGQCWAFASEEAVATKGRISKSAQDFSRGSVATLAVRLAMPIFVDRVVIEHPPQELTDRMDTAIRVFRVVGYEDGFGRVGAYELGRFEYKIGDGILRTEYPLARKLSRQNVPKLLSIALAVESTWGRRDDFGCLYRVRVQGDEKS